ncbi:MAG: hypothetical protein ACI8XZ_004350 [Gammaproteobacteria bacterium]|jgi:hypothetical protein
MAGGPIRAEVDNYSTQLARSHLSERCRVRATAQPQKAQRLRHDLAADPVGIAIA